MSEEIQQYQGGHQDPQQEPTEMQKEVAKVSVVDTLRNALLGPADDLEPGLALFVGTNKDQHSIIFRASTTWLGYQSAVREGRERESRILKNTYDEIREEHFKDVEEPVLQGMLSNYFRFYFNGLDRVLMRGENAATLHRDGWTNTISGKGDERIPFIKALTPTLKGQESLRERIRRTHLKAIGDPDTFTMVLKNSLMVLKIKVPTPLELARLINDIAKKLKLYGERYNVNSLHLERAAIAQILVEFVLERATYWSVKDTVDPMSLTKLIYTSDLNVIAQTLLVTSSPKGVVFRMYCLADKCNHSENVIIDPTGMVIDVEESMPEARRELLNELLTKGRKLSREELHDNPPTYLDENGDEIDTTIEFSDEHGSGRLRLSVPFLDEYFSCYKRMADKINPELRQLAVDYPNPKEFAAKKNEHMSALRMGDYLQWFRTYETDPVPGSGDPVVAFHRDEDPAGFDEAMIDIFNADGELYSRALSHLIKVIPRMTYTFIGIRDDICPSCKKRVGENIQELNRGITPLDPIVNFFDHTRMMIGTRASIQITQEDSLS